MNNNQIRKFSTVAYELLKSDSSEDKAFQFAAYAAYDEISKQEGLEDYTMACVASEALAEQTTKGHRYAAELTLKNIALNKSMNDKRHAQMPWEQSSQALLRLEHQDDPFVSSLTRIAGEGSDSHGLAQEFKKKHSKQEELEAIKERYARTFSAAYLAFLRASKSQYIASSEERFKASIRQNLAFNLKDEPSFGEICSYILMSTEMNIGMATYAILGLIALTLPILGVTTVAPVACYAVGGIMSISGFSFCFWQASAASQESSENKGLETIHAEYA
ncbi:MAG: hypothetical protein P1U36_09480 [Legionellaceae bacterium]|nr:hypothetical protein [Legionellaceae bacterium]